MNRSIATAIELKVVKRLIWRCLRAQ